ncbi:zinc finger protein ZFP2-like [Uranotaenia lowii]|uniref:zinc finger protein ZFP2-like n=1 Tax=Uranotaenia lowii TaxID=190385 RepID=UPI00247A1A54|nr:zinc finger protein ZFP2-like [Uranotaenia lowii]XP_055598114.1 zinc finger protein ZFP2-like [Uranotaenia lowii]XP_055598115.1 zinc finger protein ZFP2-like [Uranotaenia lowii]
MDVLIEPDCYKVCRICMETCEEDFVCVYDEFEDLIMMDVIAECARVEIRKDDALPRNICRSCAEYMIIAYHIIQKCRDSDQSLRSIFKHEIDLRAKHENKEHNFGSSELHEDEINPEEYAFLLTEAYDDMLDHVGDFINEGSNVLDGQVNVKREIEFVNSASNNVAINEGTEKNNELPQTDPIITPMPIKCCGCKQYFSDENELKTHSEVSHFKEGTGQDPAKPFVCTICYKTFSASHLLKEHKRTVNRKFACRHCGKSFMTQANLDTHFKHHEQYKNGIKCCGCRKEFENADELFYHSQQVHKPEQTSNTEKPYECDVCFRRYPTRKSLVSHKRLIQQYQCEQCGEFFLKHSFLINHEQTYHPPKKQQEDIARCCGCRKEFSNAQMLMEHISIHHPPVPEDKQKPYVCETCHKIFKFEVNLKIHRKKATQTRKYDCRVCGRSFKRSCDKSNHEATHSTELPFACSICSKRFKKKIYLRTHLKIHDTNAPKSFICQHCGKAFRTRDLLRIHSISHSEERKYICPSCPATFKRLYCLKVHTKTHLPEKAYACHICPKRVSQLSDLKRHLRTHAPGDEAKPFQCEYCLRRYPRKDYLKQHIRKQHLEKADMILVEEVALEFRENEQGAELLFLEEAAV